MSAPYPINVNIPAANNDPSDDQPRMKTNYANIDGYLKVNHVAAGVNQGAVTAGKHTYIQMPTTAAPKTTGTGEILLYNGGSGAGVGNNLFYARPGLSPITINNRVQMTRAEIPSWTGGGTYQGFTWLPGGFLQQFGAVAIPASTGVGSVTYPVPLQSLAYSIQLTFLHISTLLVIKTLEVTVTSTTGFSFNCSIGAAGNYVYWTAIGQ